MRDQAVLHRLVATRLCRERDPRSICVALLLMIDAAAVERCHTKTRSPYSENNAALSLRVALDCSLQLIKKCRAVS